MNGTTVKSTAHLIASLALRHVAQRHGGAHRGWSALAAAFFTVTAIAGNNVFQQGAADGDGDYLASNSANWGQASQVSTDGATGETTITEMSFSYPYVTTFDKLIKTTTYCWIGATGGAYDADDAWCVWRTKGNSSEYGFTQSGNNHVVMADAATQKGRLRIESGTYTAQTFQIGGNSGTAYLDVSNATLRATGDFRVASLNGGSTKGYVTIRDGAVVTAGANITIGTESGVTADVTVTNATLSAASVLYVGRASVGTGTLRVEKDATATAANGDILIGSNGGTGTLVVDGGEVSTKFWFPTCRDGTGGFSTNIVNAGSLLIGTNGNGCFELSCTSGSYTYFEQNGGYVHAPGSTNPNDGTSGYGMYIGRAAGASADVVLKGGEMVINGDVNVGDGGTGTLTIQDDGYMTVGVATAHKWMRIKNSSTVNLNGGVLDICHVEYPDGSGAGAINFDGGTLRAYALDGSQPLIGASDYLAVNVKAGGATFEVPEGVSIAVAEPLLEDANSTGGGLTKTGTGTLTLADGNTYTGTTTVNEGILVLGTGTYGAATVAGGAVLTVPAASAPSAIAIAERGLVLVDVSSLELTTDAETAINLANITLPEGAKDPALYVAPKGQKAVFTFTQSGSAWTLATVHLAAEGESAVDVFLGNGGTGTGEWRTNGHWSLGVVPTAVDTAVLPYEGTINMVQSATQTASNVVITASYVKFNSTNGWPSFGAEEITGIEGATLALQTVGLKPASGKTMKVYVDCDCVATNPDQDTWFDGNDAASRLEMHGNICATNSPFRLNGNTDIYGKLIANRPLGDDNYISGGVTFQPGSELIIGENGEVKITGSNTFEGNVTVNGVLQNRSNGTTFSAGTVLSGSGTLDFSHSADFAADIKGALTINLTGFGKNGEGKTYFGGDNSAFTGYLNSSSPYHNPYFTAASAGSEQARFNFVGDVRTKFAEGVIKFGEAKFTKNDWCVCYIDDATGPVVFEIGALSTGEDMIGSGYSFGSNKDKLTIRKVGTGLLSTWGDQYQHLEIKSGTVALKDNHGPSGTFIWTGGTLRFDAAYSWDPTPRFDCANSTVVDIDTAGYDFTWGTALTDNVGITKRGDGVLALTGEHTYTGNTTVLGGTLVLPLNTSVGTLTVADGATLAVDGSSLEVAENTPYEILTGSADSASTARVQVANSDWNWTASSSDGKISATAEAWGDVPNVWVGGEEGYWKDSVNWSRNIVPQTTHTARFNTSALVYIDGDKTMSSIDVASGARVLVKSTNINGIHPTLRPATMTGSGTVALHHAGIIPSVAMTIPDTLTIEIEKVNDGNTIDSWLEGDTAETALTINAPIIGDGYIIFRDHIVLAGDNSGFTGKVVKNADGTLTFKATKSGSAAAAWEFQGDVNTAAITEGTLSFGSLTLSGQKCWYQNSNSTMTIEVGALGKDTQFGGNFFFGAEWYNYGMNPADVMLKVVGGKLTNASYGIRKMVVAGGEMVLATPTHGDGNWESYKNNHAGYQIDSLVVEKGATLSGTTDQTVTSVKFEDGAYFGITLGGDENKPAMLTAGKFEFGKDVYGILSDAANANNGQIYAGTTMTGAPMATVLSVIGGTIAESSTADYYWTTTHGNDGVWLNAAQVTETTVGTGESSSVAIRDADLAAWLAAGDATDKVNAANGNGVTGILAYMLGAETYEAATKPTMGAEIADGVATLTFDDSAFRRVPGLKLAYYLESCDKADFSEAVTTSEPSDDPAVALEFANAKIFNRLCADVRASE